MTTALDWISNTEPEHTDDFTRLRARQIPDPYNPDATVEDWSLPYESQLPLTGAWTSGTSRYASDPVREHLSTTKQIAIFDATADVREGDRIRTAGGAIFTVTGRPDRDRSPWTGWQPTTLLNVEEGTG